jgi:F-type H+-transporting ATPase subunit b
MIKVDVTFLYIVVVFLLASGILKRFLFSPLDAILEEREGREKDAAKLHAESLTALSRAVAEAEEKLSLARRQALKIREDLRGRGSAHLEEKLDQARAAAEAAVSNATREIEAHAKASSQAMPGQARGFASSLAEKILGRKLAA